MTMGICPINKIYNAGTIPHGQRFSAGQILMVRGSQMDFTLNDHGEMSVFKKRGNRTSAVFKLFNRHPQGGQSFEAWHRDVYKAANLIDWAGYNHEKAAIDAIITQTSSPKLRQRAIQENTDYLALVNLRISQEQTKKKSTKFPDGEAESFNRLKLKANWGKDSGSAKRCEKYCISKSKGGTSCFAEGKECVKCGGLSHFQTSKLCPEENVKQATARKLEEAEDSDCDGSEESCGRILESISISVGKVEVRKKNSILYRTTRKKDFEIGGSLDRATLNANIVFLRDI